MRRVLVPAVAALILPCVAQAGITLTAPKATAFAHTIDFAGSTDAHAGTRVALFNKSQFIAAAPVRRDHTYLLKVRVGSPGPFHVEAAGNRSPDVTVKIHALLQAKLLGAPVVGSKLVLDASLVPPAAGALHIRVTRGSDLPSLNTVFYQPARVQLGTQQFGKLRVLIEPIARPGYVIESKSIDVTLLPPRLAYGSSTPAVVELTKRLRALNYAVPPASTTYGWQLVDSVIAFQKVQRIDRTAIVDSVFWSKLVAPRIPHARYGGDHIEVDKTLQVLYIVRNGQITLISPVSTAGLPGRYTPEGKFAIYRKVTGWDTSPLGLLYDPMYFTGGYAIHGNPSVPAYPASHGCVRVPMWIIPGLFVSEPYGEPVYVYSS